MRKTVFIMMICAAAVSRALYAHAFTAEEIVEKANQATYYQADDGNARVNMVITDSLGRTRERNMTILRRDGGDGKEQKYYVYFDKPSDVKGMTYLV